ncbi:3-phenylpropionate-dihydrodiol/cinnamic acid-dihydrodiol dehydrogenase [Halalkalicoccus paucihalophilus]|jgi:3-oxoacyl-[acyl-carrier protein] reductase|uniref:3-phenylpropionate-dihydrodiol/cinnamic acid-dihydrodiol dehydrogenase n=1 Tax=Halalkalicoccus paucihalophilus TaxID=1008153 RepID=A0A151AAW2_9EURY|nr:3-oxoacyl-ACP reductase family protein [Halalkalicoccus paucihalophilus]KYH24753.1 3-phenylpropionate-dihydrodiol/cinnamic acid-dihydrodiol dehydrogenase [Halalkalicoccus paucihalophilus]
MSDLFENETAIVTGASRGIGSGIATKLAEHGASVVINYRSSDQRAMEVVEEIEADGGTAVAVQADVSEYGDVEAMVEATVERFGALDILVNNAGMTTIGPAAEVDIADWRRVIDIDLTGVFIGCQVAGCQMQEQADGGAIVNIASMMGQMGYHMRAPYCAAKAGVINLTRTLAVEWAADDISVNALAPGFIKTDITDQTQDSAGYTDDDIRGRTPMARFGTVEEMANCVSFLARDDTFVTGEVLQADGGWTSDAWRYHEGRV